MKGVTLMSREYTLAGEAFFREMMRPEGERRQHPGVMDNRLGDIGVGSHPSNVVSLRDYRQRQAERPQHVSHRTSDEINALRDENERLRRALEQIEQWAQVYPLAVSPPDFKKAAKCGFEVKK
jgi:transposase